MESKKVKKSRLQTDSITDENDILRLEKYLKASNMRDYVIFMIGTNLGLRVSDFLDMPEDAQEELKKQGKKPYYTVKHFKDMCELGRVCLTQQKTNKPVNFEIPLEVKELILKYTEGRPDDAPMFESRMGGKYLTRIGFFLVLKDAVRALNIKKNVGCHTMRKIFGYFHYKKHKDIRQLMAIFNHSKEEVTLRYIGLNQEEIDRNMKAFKVGSFNEAELDAEKDEMKALKQKMLKQKNKNKVSRLI